LFLNSFTYQRRYLYINKVDGGGMDTAIAAALVIIKGNTIKSASMGLLNVMKNQESASNVTPRDLLQIYGDSYFEN
jgi:hypothetical protein